MRSQQSPKNLFPHEPGFGDTGGNRTRGLAVASYALRTVVRNRRTSSSALLGIALGVAVVTAPWVALDSTLRGMMEYYLEGVSADVEARGSEARLEEAAAALAAVPNVERTEPVRQFSVQINATESGLTSASDRYYLDAYFVNPSFESVTARLGISWDSAPSSGGVIVHESLRSYGLDPGERLVLDYVQPLYDSNGTYVGVEVRNSTQTVAGFFWTPDLARPYFARAVFLSVTEIPGFKAALNFTYELPATIFAWINRGALLDPYDAGLSNERLQRQLFLMQGAVPLSFYVSYGGSSRGASLADIPRIVSEGTFGLRVFFFVFAIPTLGLAALLARVGFDVGLSARRRELAVLRARGFSVRGVRVFLTAESLVVGALAGALGVVLSVGLSRLFSAPSLFAPSAVRTEVAVTSGTVILAFLIGWLLALGSSRRGIRLLSSEDLVTGLKAFHPEEVAIPHRASRDFLMAGIATAGFLLFLATASLEGSPLSAVTFLLGFSTAIFAPIAPFLLTAAVARYLTRGTTRAYEALSRFLRPVVGELQPLVEKNIVRAPRRASNTAIMMTFAVGFVLAVSIMAASAEAYRLESVRRQVPADIVVEGRGFLLPDPQPFWPQALGAVRNVSGVAETTLVVMTDSGFGTTFLFEASTYLQTVPWLTSTDLGGADPRQVMAALDAGGTFAANEEFQDAFGLLVGDRVSLGNILTVDVTARLTALVRDLPGIAMCCPGLVPPFTFLDFSSVPGANFTSQVMQGRILIAVEPGSDSGTVAQAVSDALMDLFPLRIGFVSVITQAEAIRYEMENAPAGAIFSYLRTQTEIAVGLSVVGVGLLVYTGAALRRDELATLVARGAGPSAVAKLVMAEGWVVSFLGLLLGILGGLVTAATFLALASFLGQTPIPFVIPLSVVGPLLAAVLGVWIASYLGALSIQRMDVARVLKLRGG